MKDEYYYFHQTPIELSKDLVKHIPLQEGDDVLEPFKGEGSFYNNFPNFVNKDWCEIEEGRDYKDYDKPFDWVISNPPFRLDNGTKRVNSFFSLLNFYLDRAKKGIAFLGNDNCLSTLTPKRIKDMNDKGFYINKIIVCSIKKWRGRYFFIIISKEKTDFFGFLKENYS